MKIYSFFKRFWKYISICVFVFCFLFLKGASFSFRSGDDFLSAEHAFNHWESASDKNNENLSNLDRIIKKHPELQACYDSLIGQGFLSIRLANEAKKYIDRTVERTRQSHYLEYTRASLLISDFQYEEALKIAFDLNKRLEKEASLDENFQKPHLFMFNLLRIALLNKELGDSIGEKVAWESFKNYMCLGDQKKGKEVVRQRFKEFLNHFTFQNASLLDFIYEREVFLSNQSVS